MNLQNGYRKPLMPYRDDVFRRGQYYHLYNRGVGEDIIFFNPGNYEHCLRLLERYHGRYGATVIVYCLMPNHYHLLVRQESAEALSRFMGVLFNAYVQAVNRQQGRRGPLFEGRFRHVWVDREEYLIHLCRYIHLNPVQARLVKTPELWQYSNYLDWIGERPGTLADESFIRDHFGSPGSYRSFVNADVDQTQALDNIQNYLLDQPRTP
jgi:putative transposase